jgi:hypothetical protein
VVDSFAQMLPVLSNRPMDRTAPTAGKKRSISTKL